MAPSTTIIPLSRHAEGAQAAVSHWLDLISKSVQPGSRRPVNDPDGENRARILQHAAMTMLAPVEPKTRFVSPLLR